MKKKEIETKVKELIVLLDYFDKIKKPLYTQESCPFREDHYRLSEATGGLECYWWNCPLCGKVELG